MNSISTNGFKDVDVMDNDNYATVLERFVISSSLQVAQVSTKKIPGLDHVVLVKKWVISPMKAHNTICSTMQHGVHTLLHLSLSRQFRTNDHKLWYTT